MTVMRISTLSILFLAIGLPGSSQTFLEWGTLADVKFESEYSEEYGIDLTKAIFGSDISVYDGQQVKVTGYMIPIDPMGTAYVLSRNPNAVLQAPGTYRLIIKKRFFMPGKLPFKKVIFLHF